MKLLLILLFSFPVFADVSQVSSGQSIQASKVNEIIDQSNLNTTNISTLNNNVNTLNSYLPTGSIIEVAGTCPSGFTQTNGQAISRTTFSNLFNKIGTEYGVGDNSTTFNVPKTTKHYLGSIRMVNCFQSITTATFNNFLPAASCTMSVTGEALVPTTNIPGVRFNYLPAGKIVVHYTGALTNNRTAGAGSVALFRLIDGVNVSSNVVVVGGATAADNAVITVPSAEWEIIRNEGASNVTIQFQARTTSVTNSYAVLNNGYVVGNVDSIMSVYHYPDKEIKGNCIKH